MRIGFDISDLATGRADGTTRYTMELAKRLPKMGSQHEWLFFCPFLSSQSEEKIMANNVKVLRSPWPKYWTQARLPFELYSYKPDVLFMPIQQLPILRPNKIRTIAVIHDLAIHKFPRQFTYKDWILLHMFSAQVSRQAESIIAVSQATADDINKYYGRTKGVFVIPHGIDQETFRLPHDEQERQVATKSLASLVPSTTKPYILYVGQIQPRKNLVRLVKAFNLIAQSDPELQLVIAGGHGWRRKIIDREINNSLYKDRICLTGTVDDKTLRALYWQAQVFVLPSLYEGFGMPVLEAMSSGCAVVTSNNSSMPEAAGGAAVLIEADNVNSIKEGILTGIRQRDMWRQKGLRRVKSCNWEKTAKQTLAVIENK